jgi:hypothetical protein
MNKVNNKISIFKINESLSLRLIHIVGSLKIKLLKENSFDME